MSALTPYLGDVLGGFTKESGRLREENQKQANVDRDRELSILSALANSQDVHPEIRSAAVTSMLTGGDKPSGLAKWFGQTTQHPAFPMIHALVGGGTMGGGPSGPVASSGTGLAGGMGTPTGSGPGSGGGIFYTPQEQMAMQAQQGQVTAAGGYQSELAKATANIDAHLGTSKRFGGPPPSAADIALWSRPPGSIGLATPDKLQSGVPGSLLGNVSIDTDGNPIDRSGTTFYDHFLNRATGQESAMKTRPPVTARPSGPEAQATERASELAAEAGETLTPANKAQYLEQARTEHLGESRTKAAQTAKAATERSALSAARIRSLTETAVATHRRANGDVPMTPAQALGLAERLKGTNPDLTDGDIGRLADAFQQASGSTRATGSPPSTSTVTPGAPPSASKSLAGAIETAGLSDVSPNYRAYSPQGRRTVQAVETMRPMLQQLVAGIKAAGLENNASPLGTGTARFLQAHGVAPGRLQTEMMQLASMAEASGFSTVSVGRLNMPMMEVLKGHLTDAGDSPKLLYDKAQGLLEKLPIVLKAVDTAEQGHIGGGRARGTGQVTVTDPKGGVHTFPSQVEADAFKRAAKIP